MTFQHLPSFIEGLVTLSARDSFRVGNCWEWSGCVCVCVCVCARVCRFSSCEAGDVLAVGCVCYGEATCLQAPEKQLSSRPSQTGFADF